MVRVVTIQHLQDFHVHQVWSPYDSAHAKLSVQTADPCGETCGSAVFASASGSVWIHIHSHQPTALGIRKLSTWIRRNKMSKKSKRRICKMWPISSCISRRLNIFLKWYYGSSNMSCFSIKSFLYFKNGFWSRSCKNHSPVLYNNKFHSSYDISHPFFFQNFIWVIVWSQLNRPMI